MPEFTLTKDSKTYTFDLQGGVKLGDQELGKWSTNTSNQLVVTQAGQADLLFDVGWKFDDNNHLVMTSGTDSVFNFSIAHDLRPVYLTRDAVLKVRPDQNHTFEISLHGEWDLSADHDLSITINGVTSVIDGFIDNSNKSRLTYIFVDKARLFPARISRLGFVGEWTFRNDDGIPKLDFKYQRADGTTDTFQMPASVAIDTTVNQLVYQYDKKNRIRRIALVGTLNVTPDFRITYSIDRQESHGEEVVKESVISIDAEFNKENFNGNLSLLLKKSDGSRGNHELIVGGNFTAVLGTTHLQAGFKFTQIKDGNKIENSFGFDGRLKLSQGGEITWEFTTNANATQLSIELTAADIEIGNARFDAKLNITAENGQVVGVSAFLGIRF